MSDQAAGRSVCVCGHTGDGFGSQHSSEDYAFGHAGCRIKGCPCKRFTWAKWNLIELEINHSGEKSWFRWVSEGETVAWKDLPAGVHVLSLDGDHALRVRQSGKVKRWKTAPVRISIPIKHGMGRSAAFNGYVDNDLLKGDRVLMHVPNAEVKIPVLIEC